MPFPLGKPILLLGVIALITGAAILLRPSPPRADLELWTSSQEHADAYEPLRLGASDAVGGSVAVRVIPNNALNLRLVSLFMADRSGTDLPDVAEIRQDALGRFLGPSADQVGFLPLNRMLETTGERTIARLDDPGAAGQSARLTADGRIYTHDGSRWILNSRKASGDHWIDRIVRQRLLPYTKDGQIFGLPHDVHPVTLTYRADLFSQAGVDLATPTPGHAYVAWPDFQARCLRFQSYWRAQGVTDRWALDLYAANADILSALLLQRGVNLIEADGRVRLTDPIVADTLIFYAGMIAGPGRISTDSASAGADIWVKNIRSATVCALITPDWRMVDLRPCAADLAGNLRMTQLPKFQAADAPTSTWSGTMIAIPRNCGDPRRAWKLIESIYLSEQGMTVESRDLGILPAVADAWSLPGIRVPNPLFGGQVVNDLYATLAPKIPLQHLTPDTAYATSALGYVLTQTVAAIRDGADATALRPQVLKWLAARQTDVQRQIEHGKMAE